MGCFWIPECYFDAGADGVLLDGEEVKGEVSLEVVIQKRWVWISHSASVIEQRVAGVRAYSAGISHHTKAV